MSLLNLTFGNQEVGTTSERQSITLSNTGEESLKIIDVTVTAPHASDFNADQQCSSVSLSSGESCTIRVSFTPSDLGSRSANLGIDHNVTGSPQADVALNGNGIDTKPPTLKLPEGRTVEAEDANGARVDYDATATDEIDGEVAVDCSPQSRSIFKLGETDVTCTATVLAASDQRRDHCGRLLPF